MNKQFDFDRSLYQELLQSVAAMTLLFGDGPNSYIDYTHKAADTAPWARRC